MNARATVTLLACALAFGACDNGAATPDLAAGTFDLATATFSSDGGIACGPSECGLGGEDVCCVESATRYCAPASACSSGTPAYCDGPEDCTGADCCLPAGSNAIVCRQQCDGAILCHGDGDCPSAQPRCCPDATTGYGVCSSAC